jgi:hypothetical protein
MPIAPLRCRPQALPRRSESLRDPISQRTGHERFPLQNQPRPKTNFVNAFKSIDISSPCSKNIHVSFYQKLMLTPAVSRPSKRGVSRIVTDVGRGMRWTQQGRSTQSRADERSCGGRSSRVVPTPRRWCPAQRASARCRDMVANKPGAPGRARSSRKTIAQGRPVVAAHLW